MKRKTVLFKFMNIYYNGVHNINEKIKKLCNMLTFINTFSITF